VTGNGTGRLEDFISLEKARSLAKYSDDYSLGL
jgi:hypothetical protein